MPTRLYAGFGVVAVAFFAWKLPETRDRSLEDTEHQIRGQSADSGSGRPGTT